MEYCVLSSHITRDCTLHPPLGSWVVCYGTRIRLNPLDVGEINLRWLYCEEPLPLLWAELTQSLYVRQIREELLRCWAVNNCEGVKGWRNLSSPTSLSDYLFVIETLPRESRHLKIAEHIWFTAQISLALPFCYTNNTPLVLWPVGLTWCGQYSQQGLALNKTENWKMLWPFTITHITIKSEWKEMTHITSKRRHSPHFLALILVCNTLCPCTNHKCGQPWRSSRCASEAKLYMTPIPNANRAHCPSFHPPWHPQARYRPYPIHWLIQPHQG